ncbi:MAG TPA: hypothetical protein PLL20_11425 [Phycisphaerae bacterium]|nr:hypothetical protein [Phycisphaerae bacterium]
MRCKSAIGFSRVLALVGLSLLVPLSGQMCSPGPGPGATVCIELSDDIDTATTLSAACYRVTSNIDVNAPLTINPGVTLEFDAGRSMSVNSGGSLRAVGTTENPIVFTGREAVPGYWGGLTIYYSNSSNNRLEHVTIEYGGSSSGANLTTTGTATEPPRLAIVNCTLRNSAGYGLYLDGDSVITDFSTNTLTGNALGAASVAQNVIGVLDAASTYSGNTRDVVNVHGGSVSSAQTWQAIDADYLFDSSDLDVDADLIISAGATLVFGQARAAWINENGSLKAIGTSTAPIAFTAKEATAGYWKGVEYYYSNSVNNRLEHVTIEYGGSPSGANLTTTGTASVPPRLAIVNCTLRNSAGYGLYLDGDSVITDFSTNTLTGNALGAASVAQDVIGVLDAASTYSGNTRDVVNVRGGSVSSAQTWQAIDADYLFDSDDLIVDADLTISAGATLVFGQGRYASVNENGSLKAIGTSTAPIIFTGKQATAGYWECLLYYYTTSVNNVLEYVRIEYGGGSNSGNLRLSGNARATARNCTFAHSGGYGVYVDRNATINNDVETANQFSDNALGNVFISP